MDNGRGHGGSRLPGGWLGLAALSASLFFGGVRGAKAAFPSLVFQDPGTGQVSSERIDDIVRSQARRENQPTLGQAGDVTAATPPENPHSFMERSDSCGSCHSISDGAVDPHVFVVSVVEKCGECHGGGQLGLSHPVGSIPEEAAFVVEVPEELPLEEGKVSCGTCHNPHLQWLDATRSYDTEQAAYAAQEGDLVVELYRTYYVRASDPVKGFEPLCTGCHRNY